MATPLHATAPPGFEDVVSALKGQPGVDNEYALAWWLHDESIAPKAAAGTAVAEHVRAFTESGKAQLYNDWYFQAAAIEAAEWSTATVDALPDSSFAVVEPGGEKDSDGLTTPRSLRHLPYKSTDGTVDVAHVRNALARLATTTISPAQKDRALKVLRRAAKSTGVDVSDDVQAARLAIHAAALPETCPHCESTDTALRPPDFESAHCNACHKTFGAARRPNPPAHPEVRLQGQSHYAKCPSCGAETSEEERAAETCDSCDAPLPKEPSQAQKDAGNFQMQHLNLHGLRVSIENPEGTIRSGVARDGTPWSTTLTHPYGYVVGHEGADGDQIDAFVGPHPTSELAHVVDQVDPETGGFDEHKIILGARNAKEAKAIYRGNFQRGWKGLGAVSQLTMPAFKHWLEHGDLTKPLKGQVRPPSQHFYAMRLEAAAFVVSPISAVGGDPDHPNRMPFKGVLCYVDRPSERAPGGADGHRVLIPRALAEAKISTIIGMGVDCIARLTNHDDQRKVGVVDAAAVGRDPAPEIPVRLDRINPDDVVVAGWVWASDFADDAVRIQQKARAGLLGMSYEVDNVHVVDAQAPIWTLTDLTFTGAAILERSKAAYDQSRLAATAQEEFPMAEETVSALTARVDRIESSVNKLTRITLRAAGACPKCEGDGEVEGTKCEACAGSGMGKQEAARVEAAKKDEEAGKQEAAGATKREQAAAKRDDAKKAKDAAAAKRDEAKGHRAEAKKTEGAADRSTHEDAAGEADDAAEAKETEAKQLLDQAKSLLEEAEGMEAAASTLHAEALELQAEASGNKGLGKMITDAMKPVVGMVGALRQTVDGMMATDPGFRNGTQNGGRVTAATTDPDPTTDPAAATDPGPMPTRDTLSASAVRLLARGDVTADERMGAAPMSEERIDQILKIAGIKEIDQRINLKRELMGRGAGL